MQGSLVFHISETPSSPLDPAVLLDAFRIDPLLATPDEEEDEEEEDEDDEEEDEEGEDEDEDEE
jgi:hypothetical protein